MVHYGETIMEKPFHVVGIDEEDGSATLLECFDNSGEAALLWRQHNDYTSDVKPEMVIEAPALTGKSRRVTWQEVPFHVGWTL